MSSSGLHRRLHAPPPSLPPSSSSTPPNPNPATTPPPQDHLTRHQVLKRRADNLRGLATVYTEHYWAMVEELKGKYKDYVWKYGLSPYKEGDDEEGSRGNKGLDGNMIASALCAFNGCALKAMALTRFCHLHILSDSKQVLYKPCEYVIKSAQAGPITCGRPILRTRLPAFCNVHLQKTHRALKKARLHVSSSKLAPKLHVIVAEYVHEIQAKRRAALRENRNNVVVKRESCD